MKLYIWYWIGGGYNSCLALSKSDALKIGNAMCSLKVDEKTLGLGTYKELSDLDAHYSSLYS